MQPAMNFSRCSAIFALSFLPIAKFAEYGFNRAHAAAYAVISYQTAYLKANYPIEYMTSLLIHYQGSADKVATAIVDCKKRGIDVLPPEINESRSDFSITGDRIRFGLAAIKNVGRSAVELIVRERDSRGEYSSLDDLCERIAGSQDVNARALESLVRSGACDTLGERNQLLATLEMARQRAERARRDRESGQTSLFGLVEAPEQISSDYLVRAEPMNDEEKLRSEKELLGLYLSDHPLNRIEAELAQLTDTQAVELSTDLSGNEVRVGGLLRSARRVVTRKGQIMAYAELEDLTGTIEVTFFPRAYEQLHRDRLDEPDRVIVVQGRVEAARPASNNRPTAAMDEELDTEEEAEQVAVLAEAAWAWDDPECAPVERQQTAHVDIPESGIEVVEEIADLLARHPGSDEVMLHFHVQGKQVTLQVGQRFRVAAGPALKSELDAHFGCEVTRLETVRPRAAGAGNGGSRDGNGRGNGRYGNERANSG
jgi:DNA polymerase III alpha subunit